MFAFYHLPAIWYFTIQTLYVLSLLKDLEDTNDILSYFDGFIQTVYKIWLIFYYL